MRKEYTHIQAVETEMLEMKIQGKTNREIADHYGFRDKYVVKQWYSRYKRRKKLVEAGIQPRRRGRPPKGYEGSDMEKENEIRRLKMENALLRDFLRLAGRR